MYDKIHYKIKKKKKEIYTANKNVMMLTPI